MMHTKNIAFWVLLLCFSFVYAKKDEKTKKPMTDIVVNGKVTERGTQDCASRYHYIKKFLDGYTRAFTLLDLYARLGTYSFHIASEYDATCILLEHTNPQRLHELCVANT